MPRRKRWAPSEAAQLALATAEGGKVRANHDLAEAEGAEAGARERFHDAEDRMRGQTPG
jgi:hypothetical protein